MLAKLALVLILSPWAQATQPADPDFANMDTDTLRAVARQLYAATLKLQEKLILETKRADETAAKLVSAEADAGKAQTRIAQLEAELGKWKPSNTLASSGENVVNLQQIAMLGSRYKDKQVTVLKCMFIEVDMNEVWRLPLVAARNATMERLASGPRTSARGTSNPWEVSTLGGPSSGKRGGGPSQRERDPLPPANKYESPNSESWNCFVVSDGSGERFRYVYVLRDEFGDMLVSLQRGNMLNLRGTVVRLAGDEAYGLICTRIERCENSESK